MPHTPAEKKRALARVRRLRGQIEALDRTLVAGGGCADVLQQLSAIRGAVTGLLAQVLESHILESFTEPGLADRTRLRRVREINTLVRTYLK